MIDLSKSHSNNTDPLLCVQRLVSLLFSDPKRDWLFPHWQGLTSSQRWRPCRQWFCLVHQSNGPKTKAGLSRYNNNNNNKNRQNVKLNFKDSLNWNTSTLSGAAPLYFKQGVMPHLTCTSTSPPPPQGSNVTSSNSCSITVKTSGWALSTWNNKHQLTYFKYGQQRSSLKILNEHH